MLIAFGSSGQNDKAFAEELLSSVVSEEESLNTEESESVVFTVEVLQNEASSAGKHRVLIYHTHTYEAYEQAADNRYDETERWRTQDERFNVVAVGKALSASLKSIGVDVTHDTTVFELPDLSSAYDRSLSMLEGRKRAGESYDLYIDLHRDALASTADIKRTVNIGGVEVARFMVLVGKGTTGGYQEKPDWEKNIIIAERITEGLNSVCQGLARNVKVKTGRFNQHISDACILIECGVNTNTLEEVLAGIPYLAEAIKCTLGKTE